MERLTDEQRQALDEAVEAANGAIADERRLPESSMRAALLAALPHLASLAPRDEQAGGS